MKAGAGWLRNAAAWLDGIDPGGRRRIRGLRLATGFAVASMAGVLAMPGAGSMNAAACAGTYAIWASVYEAAPTRRRAGVALLVLIAASAVGTIGGVLWLWIVGTQDGTLALLPLAGGAFMVDYAKRWVPLGTGIGSMAFIGQALGSGLGLTWIDLPTIGAAALIAAATTVVLRILGGASERDADALARCQDFRRTMAARLRRYHDALHRGGDDALARILPRSGELTAAWAALDTLVSAEFTETDLMADYLHAEIRRLYALLQSLLAIGDSLTEMRAAMPGLRERAAIGLVLHTLRSIVLEHAKDADPALVATLRARCDRLIAFAQDGPERAIGTRIALLRIGLATPPGVMSDPAPMQAKMRHAVTAATGHGMLPTTRIAFQSGLSALAIMALNATLGLHHVLWALAASTYVISSSIADTWSRGARRIAGTAVGVALGLGMALMFAQVPLIVWALAALAMIVYSTWLPMRYDIACGAYAFALVVTLAEAGDSSWGAASVRGLDTVIGAAIGMAVSVLVLPVRLRDQLREMLAMLLAEARDRVAGALSGAAPGNGSAGLLAEVEAQKARFAGLHVEGVLARDGDGGALLLLRLEALIASTLRLLGEADMAATRVDPALRDTIAALSAHLLPAFDAVLTRLRRQGRPPVPGSEALVPLLRAYMIAPEADAAGAAGALLAAALTHTSRKISRTLADLAAELDRRDGAAG